MFSSLADDNTPAFANVRSCCIVNLFILHWVNHHGMPPLKGHQKTFQYEERETHGMVPSRHVSSRAAHRYIYLVVNRAVQADTISVMRSSQKDDKLTVLVEEVPSASVQSSN
jgi:hypothetical protein